MGNIKILKDEVPTFDLHNNLLLINRKDKEIYIYEPDEYENEQPSLNYLRPAFLRTLVNGAMNKLSFGLGLDPEKKPIPASTIV